MIQSFRDKMQGIFAFVLVLLISIPFVLFGVDSLFTTSSNQGEVAEVDGEAITERELLRAIAMQRQQMIGRFGDQLPEEFVSDERLRGPVLDQLVLQKAEIQEAKGARIAVSDQAIDQILLSEEAFQLEGQFSPQMYRQRLASLGFTPASYKAVLQDEIIGNQLRRGVSLSAFTTEGEVLSTLIRAGQTRDFYYATLAQDKFSEGAEPSPEAVEAQYKANPAQYMGQEKVKVEYISLDASELASLADVSEQEAKDQHEQNISVFEGTERRRAAHILVEDLGDGADAEKVAQITQRLADGEAFADIAKELSDDILSAEEGGDLGFTSGDSFPEAFEEKLAAMAAGDVSEAVSTEAGVHFIQLLEIDKPEAPSFESSRDEIMAQLVEEKGLARFEELAFELEEEAYNATDLSAVATQIGADAVMSDWVSRDGVEGILAQAKVLSQVFSDEVLKNRQTSAPIELGETQLVVVRVADYQAPAVKAFETVEAQIAATLKNQTIAGRQRSAADALLAAVSSGGDLEALAKEGGYTWEVVIKTRRDNFQVDRELLQPLFDLQPAQLPATEVVNKANGDLVVIQLNKISELDANEIQAAEKLQLAKQLEQQDARNGFVAYQQQLKSQATVELF